MLDMLNVSDKAMNEQFHIVYDGWALEHHLMDVRDLAPAMIATSDLLNNVNRELNGDKVTISLQVKASFKAGSFGIELHSATHFLSQVRDIFNTSTATSLATAGGILCTIGFIVGKTSLIDLLRFLKGAQPLKVEDDQERKSIYVSETKYIVVDKDVFKLYKSRTIISDLNKILEPLNKDGIDSFGVVSDKKVQLSIAKSELEYFVFHDAEDSLAENVTTKYIQIESISFKENTKWKFSTGGVTFFADIKDDTFLHSVDSGARFGKGDLLKVEIIEVQTMANGKLKSEFTIRSVLEHKIIEQGKLDL
jgi:hypothetical protein